MICKNCSFDNSEEMNFCQNCGASLADAKAEKINSVEEENIATEENNVPQTENTTSIKELEGFKDGKGFKFYLFRIIIPVIALFLIVFIGITTLKPDKYSVIKNQIIYNYNDEGDYTEIYFNSTKLDNKIDSSFSITSTSINGDIAIGKNYNDELYYINKKGIKKIDEEVESSLLSKNGKFAVYVKNEENDDDRVEVLYLFNISKEKSEKISDDEISNYFISPDGKSVVYSTTEDESYFYTNGKATKIDNNGLEVISVSNSGKYIYAYDSSEETLYVLNKKGDKEKITNNFLSTAYYFNDDNTQILFYSSTSNGVGTYISKKGEEKIKISSGICSVLLPEYVSTDGISNFLNQYYIDTSSNIFSSLLNSVDVFYINKKGDKEDIVSSVSNPKLSSNGKYLFYINYNDIFRSKAEKDAKEQVIATSVDSDFDYAVIDEYKKVYYIDDDSALRFCKNGKDSEKISDDVDKFIQTGKDLIIFTDTDNQLFSSKNGGDKKKIDDDVISIYSNNFISLYKKEIDDEYKTFVSNGNEKFNPA